MNDHKSLVSGIKPTGKVHLGNYLGAIKQFVDLQESYKGYIFVADYHALTNEAVQGNPEQFSKDSLDVVIDYLALGLDPEKTVIFKQSDVPEVTELTWIFNCLVTVPYLMRGHAYKDAEAKNIEINSGVMMYPVLMAADILIQNPDIVPVGEDQRQHVEIARDMARKFNNTYGETFKIPQEKIMGETAIVPGVDGRKMSKSYGNTIELFSEDNEILKRVMSIVTDSKAPDEPKDPEKDNIFALHKFFTQERDLKEISHRYRAGDIGYKESKEILAGNIIKFVAPLREKRKQIANDPTHVQKVLKEGGEKAREHAQGIMREVRKKIGIN